MKGRHPITPRFGHGTEGALRGPGSSNTVLHRARNCGIAGDVEALQLALAALIADVDQLLATTPERARPVVIGALPSLSMARAILATV